MTRKSSYQNMTRREYLFDELEGVEYLDMPDQQQNR